MGVDVVQQAEPTVTTITKLGTDLTAALDQSLANRIAGAVEGAAGALVINDNSEYEKCAAIHATLYTLLHGPTADETSIDETFDPVIKALHAAHKTAIDAKKKHSVKVEGALSSLNAAMLNYRLELQRKEKERQERERLDQARRERVDRAAQLGEALSKYGVPQSDIAGLIEGASEKDIEALESLVQEHALAEERKKQEQEKEEAARQAEKLGMADVAKQIREQAPVAVVPMAEVVPPRRSVTASVPAVAPVEDPGVKGQRFAEKWGDFEVENPDLIPREFILPADPYDPAGYPKIRQFIRAMKSGAKIDGIKVLPPKPILSGRAR